MIAVGRPRTLPRARRPKRRVRAFVGHDRQLQSRLVDHDRYSRSRAYVIRAATHLLKELPRGEHLAVLTGARPFALHISARTRLGTKGKRCSVPLILRCTLIVCIRHSRSDSAQHFTLTDMQLLLRLPCVARRLGALEICTSTRTMRQSSVAHASGSCITIAGGSQVPHFHQKRENLRVRHFGTPPRQGLVPPHSKRTSLVLELATRGFLVTSKMGVRSNARSTTSSQRARVIGSLPLPNQLTQAVRYTVRYKRCVTM